MMNTGRSSLEEQLLRRIQGEFLEMPGLRLTPDQARRLWGLDPATCADVLDVLVSEKFLMLATDGRYTRLSDGDPALPLRMAKVESDGYSRRIPA